MGKLDEEGVPVTSSSSSLSAADSSSTDPRRGGCRSSAICRFLSLKCFLSVIFSLAVIVSSVFWLLSYIQGADREDLVLWRSGAQIEATFKLQRPVSFLSAKSTILKLEYDILGEIGVPNTTVVIISLHSHSRSNWTNVVFGVLPYAEDSPISSAGLSILRSSLVALVIQQSNLQLTPSMFGIPSSFEVLKFPGGITITPEQHVFLLQKVQVRFNFTLNYPIYQIQDNLDELKNQLKLGLHLRHHEALYVKLTNLKGSTLSPPVIVQASTFAEVGLPLAAPRVKQLAQTITDSPERNLGLNHRVFGKVKEVRLSSYLPYSLGGDGSPSPAPAPHQLLLQQKRSKKFSVKNFSKLIKLALFTLQKNYNVIKHGLKKEKRKFTPFSFYRGEFSLKKFSLKKIQAIKQGLNDEDERRCKKRQKKGGKMKSEKQRGKMNQRKTRGGKMKRKK